MDGPGWREVLSSYAFKLFIFDSLSCSVRDSRLCPPRFIWLCWRLRCDDVKAGREWLVEGRWKLYHFWSWFTSLDPCTTTLPFRPPLVERISGRRWDASFGGTCHRRSSSRARARELNCWFISIAQKAKTNLPAGPRMDWQKTPGSIIRQLMPYFMMISK